MTVGALIVTPEGAGLLRLVVSAPGGEYRVMPCVEEDDPTVSKSDPRSAAVDRFASGEGRCRSRSIWTSVTREGVSIQLVPQSPADELASRVFERNRAWRAALKKVWVTRDA